MVADASVLPTLLTLVDRIPFPPSATPAIGRPPVYSPRLIVKALVVMVLKRWYRVGTFYAAVTQPTPEMRQLRAHLTEDGRFPSRRTWDRRLGDLPPILPALIAAVGAYLVEVVQPWGVASPLAAIDSTVFRAHGGVWHKKHRDAKVVPHSSIDTEAGWTKSGWHGWVYGWKLHLVVAVAAVWLPLAAELTPANVADNEQAYSLLTDLPQLIRHLVGDTAYQDGALHEQMQADGRVLIASKRGVYPHTDEGVEVRRMFHQLRSKSIENFNEQFKAIIDGHAAVPTKGKLATRRFVLGGVLAYQLAVLYRHETGGDLRIGLKPMLLAA